VWIDELRVYPDVAARQLRVRVALQNATGQPVTGTVGVTLTPASSAAPLALHPTIVDCRLDAQGGVSDIEVPLGDAVKTWDEFSPALYRVSVVFRGRASQGNVVDEARTTFGLREITTQGTQFLINGRKTFFRGTLECCVFPKTGHPPTDVASWKRIINVAKAHGLNLIRFHSWCPPEAAFVAADELGFYFHIEAASWANQSTTLGDGKPVDRWIYEETRRILKAYGNHPSFVLMLYGNEPGGEKYGDYLAQWVRHFKAEDNRRLFSGGAGWPQLAENAFHVTPDPRIQGWGEGLKSRLNGRPPETLTDYRDYVRARSAPVISHEIGQWCVYPNFEEIAKYTGYLKPKNFEIFRATLAAHGMGDQARDFLRASGKLQTLCYKEDIESALRTPGMGGFELLDLRDFPGQGTALVGVLDPFWEGKGYVTAKQFQRFCHHTVPLARLAKRVFTSSENLRASLEAAHFGPAPLTNVAVQWRLLDDANRAVAAGSLPPQTIPLGNGLELGRIDVPLAPLRAPARYRLEASFSGAHGANDWDIWVYPEAGDPPPPDSGLQIVSALDAAALATLNAGGKVLLLIPPGQVKNDPAAPVALGFSSIFWNTAWTARQAPTTLGILCDPRAGALAKFPTDFHSNWQWWYLINHASAMLLDGLPADLRPTIQVIDDWVTARKLGLLFEGKIGAGKLVVCSLDLRDPQNPVARQLKRSLLAYMRSREFAPKVRLTPEQIRGLMQPSR